MHVAMSGKAALVLLPAFSSIGDLWRRQAEALAGAGPSPVSMQMTSLVENS